MSSATITWTKIDEAPALATHALLPIVRAFMSLPLGAFGLSLK